MAPELNVRATILITRALPGTATMKVPATISWRGSRFHVHVESGLPVGELLDLANSPRGFGREPRTVEEFMDTWTQLSGPTEVYGDRAASQGTVIQHGQELALDGEQLVRLAELVLSGEVTGLQPTGRTRLLEREATEYTTYLSGAEGARSKVRRLVSGPYTLLREVTDEKRRGALLRVEVSRLEEGAATDVNRPA